MHQSSSKIRTELRKIEVESGVFTLYSGNIIQFQPSEVASKSIEKSAEGFATYNEISEEGLAGAIIDIRHLKKGVTKEVRDYTAKQLYGRLYGTAILVDSSLSRIIGNMMLSFMAKGPHKRKIFNTLDDCINWLDEQRNRK